MKKNVIFMVISTVLRMLGTLVTFLLVAKWLGVEQFGIFAFFNSFALLATIIVEFGHSNSFIKRASERPSEIKELYETSIKLKLIISSIVVLLSIFFCVFFDNIPYYFLALILSNVILIIADFLLLPCRLLNQYEKETKVVSLGTTINFIILLTVAFFFRKAEFLSFAYLASRISYFSICYFYMRSWNRKNAFRERDEGNRDKLNLLSIINKDGKYAIDSALVNARNYVDSIFVGLFLGTSSVAIFQMAMNIAKSAERIPPVIANVYMASICRKYSLNESVLKDIIQTYCINIGYSLVFYLFLSMVTEDTIIWILGPEYLPVYTTLKYVGLYVLLRTVAITTGMIMTSFSLQAYRALLGVLSLIIMLSLGATMASNYGINGMFILHFVVNSFLIISFIYIVLKKRKI